MCDYSISDRYGNRPAKVGEILTLHQFEFGSNGFIAPEGNNYYKDALHFEGHPEPILLKYLPLGLTIEVLEVPVLIAEAVTEEVAIPITEETADAIGAD